MVTHMLQRAWGQGAVGTTGRVRGRGTLGKGRTAFIHRMTQRQKGIRLEREPEGSCKVLFPEGRGRHCWKSDETGRLSGLLVAVLDRDSVLSHSASDPPTWVVTRDEPTDKTDARKSGFPT